ncbi:MAG: carbohydrate ABC transporter permease [Planctomycetota bacterium]|jgi:multiple sugar transport system permease protein
MARRHRGSDYSLGGYLFLVPNFTGFAIFVFLPVIASLVFSFCQWHIFNDPGPRFNGFANYATLLSDPKFWKYTYNTVFLMLGIPIGMALSLMLALLLNKGIRAIRLFRMVYFLPTVSSGVALLVLWLVIYNPNYGLFNFVLSKIGIEGPAWLSSGIQFQWLKKFGIDPMCFWSKIALMIMGLWSGVGGYNMILYLAGLQGINPELYEAADVDGANAWHKFRNITWPMLSPTTFFIFIMSLIGGFQGGFQAAYVMTEGGPEGSTTTISYHIFNELYVKNQAGFASSIAWFLFAVVFILTMISWRYGGRVVHHE